jgi:hypothetical protein
VRDGGTPATEVVLPSRRKARTVVRRRALGASVTCHRCVERSARFFDQSPDE